MANDDDRIQLEQHVAELAQFVGPPPEGYVDRIMVGRRSFEADCARWFAEIQSTGVPYLIVANDKFENAGEGHYPIPVTDPDQFWTEFERVDGRNEHEVLRVFRTINDVVRRDVIPRFGDQFLTDPQRVKAEPSAYGFPPRPDRARGGARASRGPI
jgi:hypothetical protein